MSSTGASHQDHLESAFLYALRALPSSEIALFETHLAGCEACRREIETIRPVIGSFVSWPADVLRPSTSLWARLSQRVCEESGIEPISPPAQASPKLEWEEVAPGIHCKLLSVDSETNLVSMLVRLDPGTDYPPHRHAAVEELHLLHGELMIDDRKLYPGDFNRAEPGTEDQRVWSETGCTCVLITSTRDVLF